MAPSQGLDSELESFRQQWLSEVHTKHGEQQPRRGQSSSWHATSGPAPRSRVQPASRARPRKTTPTYQQDQDNVQTRLFEEDTEPHDDELNGSVSMSRKELVSALDHYEEAMAKEAEGNMSESLKLYRRAYRLDNRVDRRYREKHFPPTNAPKVPSTTQEPESPRQAQRPPAAPTTSNTANSDHPVLLPIKDLIASFANLQIEPAPPETEGTPPPPCPISSLPSELLIHIMHEVATHDIGDFARLSLVCKPFAYMVATEQQIWREVALGTKFGFTGMHYHWNRTTDWTDLSLVEEELRDGHVVSVREIAARRVAESVLEAKALIPDTYASWKHMFRSRPRIRFNGCYISTVNYVRMGQASTNQATWGGSPVHIVTYYRYLRFFRDGTAISLLTTSEPSSVVPHLTRDLLRLHRDNAHAHAHAHLPSAVMQKAYKGRWRLTPVWEVRLEDQITEAGQPQEGDLTLETETHDPKYMFRMDLSLRTAGKGAKNNKIVWRGHFSYNKLTDDWAEFTLKHDRAFFFSRVKSYGIGE